MSTYPLAPSLAGRNDGLRLALHRDHHDMHLGMRCFQRLEHLHAAELRQIHVEKHHVGLVLLRQFERRVTLRRVPDRDDAQLLQKNAQVDVHVLFVVYDQSGDGGVMPRLQGPGSSCKPRAAMAPISGEGNLAWKRRRGTRIGSAGSMVFWGWEKPSRLRRPTPGPWPNRFGEGPVCRGQTPGQFRRFAVALDD